jgi:hypothetical protein
MILFSCPGSGSCHRVFYLLYAVDKQLYGRRKDLILFPDQVSGRPDPGDDGPHAEGAVPCRVDQSVETDGIAKAVFHKQGGVIDQVVGRDDMQGRKIFMTRKKGLRSS